MSGDDDELQCERQGPVVLLRMNRPHARNALNTGLVRRLSAALADLNDDQQVRAVVLTGTAPGFCAGSDLKELAGLTPAGVTRHEAATAYAVRAVQRLGLPVIAAVEGFAIGGGFLLATGCDGVVSDAGARWHLPEVRLGWVPPWGLQSLVARAGPAAAKLVAWGDRPLTGADLHRLAVVDEITGPGEAVGCALAWAGRLAALPAHAVASTKLALAAVVADSAEAMDARTTALFDEDCRSGAARHTLSAYGPGSGRDSVEQSR